MIFINGSIIIYIEKPINSNMFYNQEQKNYLK